MGEDGRTPHERMKGRRCLKAVAVTGEVAHFRPVRQNEGASISEVTQRCGWVRSLAVERRWFGTLEGVVRAFAVRDDEKWDRKATEEFESTPRRLVPHCEGEDVPMVTRHQADGGSANQFWRKLGQVIGSSSVHQQINVSQVWVHCDLPWMSSSRSWHPSTKSHRRMSHKDRAKTWRI